MLLSGNKKRNTTIDIMRGIGILSVVIGHLWQSEIGKFPYQLGVNYVYSYHLAVFLFCSGYVFQKASFKSFLIKKVKTLYIPTVAFGVISFIFYPLFFRFGVIDELSIKTIGKKILSILTFSNSGILVGQLWFMPFLFLTIILFYFTYSLADKVNKKYFFIIESIVIGAIGFCGLFVVSGLESSNICLLLVKRYYIFQAMLAIPILTAGYYFR